MVKDKLVKDQDKVIVRLPDGMRPRLKDAAQGSNQTMNAEIVSRLEASFAGEKIVADLARAEEKLVEKEAVIRELRRQIEILERNVAEVKEGRHIELGSEAVQQAMIQHLHQVMGSVVDDMREENKLTNGLHLLLEWFATNPDERAEYEALPESEREEFAKEKTHELWLAHLNERRANNDPLRKGPRKVKLDK